MNTVESAPPVVSAIDDPMTPSPYRVERVVRETRDTFTFDLRPETGGPCLTFRPGQFTMLYAFGIGEIPISISGDPRATDRLTHTVRDVGAVSHALASLKKGDVVGVRGPFGHAWPVDEAHGQDVVLLPGGIGLAPLRPALYHILSHRESYRRVFLLYGARTPQDLLFRQELHDWRARLDLDVAITVDAAQADWYGNVGVVTTLIPRTPLDPERTVAMICGPEIMMRFTAMELQTAGVAPENIYVSMERNMKCAIGFCGHCQLGGTFICKDGPVFTYERMKEYFGQREV